MLAARHVASPISLLTNCRPFGNELVHLLYMPAGTGVAIHGGYVVVPVFESFPYGRAVEPDRPLTWMVE